MTSLKDPETAAESHSNPEAALALGQLLLDTGQPLAAIKSFKSAAAGGNSTAMHLLGRMHQLGWGIPADPVLAADYYNRACSSGEPWSMFNLAELYLSGSGVAQSDDEAYRLYALAAKQGNAQSLNMLGMMAEDSRGPEGPEAALDHYLAAAAAGDGWGCFNAARLLIAQARIDEAMEWIDRSLSEGSPVYLRIVADALIDHEGSRIKKRGVWAETLHKRHAAQD